EEDPDAVVGARGEGHAAAAELEAAGPAHGEVVDGQAAGAAGAVVVLDRRLARGAGGWRRQRHVGEVLGEELAGWARRVAARIDARDEAGGLSATEARLIRPHGRVRR